MKILIHAINGIGLGHLMRTLEVARALTEEISSIKIVFVTNSAFPYPLTSSGFKAHRLKYHTKMLLAGRISYQAYLRMNDLQIRDIIRKEAPDVFLMDSEFNAPIADYCSRKGIKTCFVLRSTTDEKLGQLAQGGLIRKVDLVLIPHREDELSLVQRQLLSDLKNAVFTGPIVRDLSEHAPKRESRALRILITFSAGADIPGNRVLFAKVSEFLVELRSKKMKIGGRKAIVNIVTGPYFKKAACDLHGFDHKKFLNDMPAALAQSDLVIAPAGYNLINEIIAARTPAFLMPVETREDVQQARASRMEDLGCAVVVKVRIWDSLEAVLVKDGLKAMRAKFPEITPGNSLAAREIIALIRPRLRVLDLRGCWLPLSERFIHDETCHLQRYQPSVLCLKREDNFEGNVEVLSNERFFCLWQESYPLVQKENASLYMEMIRWALEEIRTRGISILHAEFLSDAIFFLELKRRSGLPLVVSVRGHDLYANKVPDLRPVFVEAEVFLVRSERMKKDIITKGCAPEKVIVQHSGIRVPEARSLSQRSSGNINLLMVGRFVDKKGTVLGIRIFEALVRKFKSLKLYIVGGGPLNNDVVRAVRESSAASRITILGELPNDKVLELMKRCHILLHPSVTAVDGDREGVPGVIMEAMAHGAIVVASDNGSIPEIVLDNRTGFLFKEGDVPGAVLQVSRVIKKMGQLNTLRMNAFNAVKAEFNVVDQSRKLEEIYDRMIYARQISRFERYYENYRAMSESDRPGYFRVDIHPVRGCNSFCLMCDNWKNGKTEIIPTRRLLDMLREMKEFGVKEVRFHGQEPTLRKDLPKIIDRAKAMGLRVGLKTNCVGFTEDYCRKIAGIDKLYVSIDSPVESIHNKLRGNPRSFQDNIRAITFLWSFNKRLIVDSNSVVTRLNFASLRGMPQFALQHGISRVSFVLPNSKNRKDIAALLMRKKEMEEFFFKIVPGIIEECAENGIGFDFSPFFADLVLEHPAQIVSELRSYSKRYREEIDNFLNLDYGKKFYEKFGCFAPIDHASVNYDGNIYPCCVVERNESSAVGNVAQTSFQEVWQGEKYSGIRQKTLRSRGTCCDQAATCASNFSVRKYLSQRIRLSQRPDEEAAVRYIEEMSAAFSLKRPILDEMAEAKLKAVLQDARESCDFYKSRISLKSAKNAGFSSVPFLTKDDVRDHVHRGLISRRYVDHQGLVLERTSGSVGEAVPYAYLRGFHRYARMVYPFLLNTAWKWGEQYCVFTTLHCSRERCSSDNLPYYVDRLKIPTSDHIFTDRDALERASVILKENPRVIVHADPVYLCAVARHLQGKKRKIALKGISSTYELLTPSVKRYLESTFSCRVFDNYGCSEVGPIAFSCEKGSKHVFENSVLVEIVDKGSYLDPEVGEIVVTSLDNPAMPLIRYRTGDLGKIISQTCGCKRQNQLIEVYGRREACLKVGSFLYTERDIANVLDIPGVLLYQMTENSGVVHLDVITEKEYESAVKQKELLRKVERRLAKFIERNVTGRFAGHLKPEASGKFKTIVTDGKPG